MADQPKTAEQLADERRQYVTRVMNPATYGIAPGPLSTPEAVGDALIRLRSAGVNILGPECRIDYIPRNHLVSLRWAFFDRMFPAPTGPTGKQGNGTWYEQQGGGLSPAYGMLTKLAALTGLRWLMCERADDGSIPLYWNYRVGAEVKYFDGTTRPELAETPYDLRDGSPEAKMVRGKDERSVADQLGRMRAKGAQRAESFAKSRVIRPLLGLDQKYDEKQADMPFVWPTLVFVPPSDPELDRLLALKEMGLIGDLYGGGAPRPRVIDVTSAPVEQRALPAPGPAPVDYQAQTARLNQRAPAAASTPTADNRPPWERDEAAKPRGGSSDVAGYKVADVIDYVDAKGWGAYLELADDRKARIAAHLATAAGKADIDNFLATVGGGDR
jgi:hypothetical protein